MTVLISYFISALNYQNKHSVSHIRGGQYDQNIVLQNKKFYNNIALFFGVNKVMIPMKFHNSINFNTTAKSYTSSLTNKTSKVSNKMNKR